MLSEEQGASVAFGKGATGVEGQAQGGAVGREPGLGRGVVFQAMAVAEFRIEHGAAMDVRVAKVGPGGGNAIELLRGDLVAEHVPAVIREPKRARAGLKIKAHGVANALGDDLIGAGVSIHAQQAGVGRLGVADIARGPHGDQKLAVSVELDVLPAVVLVRGQGVGDDLEGGGLGEGVLDAL